MSWLGDKLRSWGWLPDYADDDRLEAETDNLLHDVQKGHVAAKEQYAKNDVVAQTLRDTMLRSRMRVQNFAQFEERIKAMANKQRASEGN